MENLHLENARIALRRFAVGETSFVADALPSSVVQLDDRAVFDALYNRLGTTFTRAMQPSEQIPSPRAQEQNGEWLKHSDCVGINLRTTNGLLGALKYVLTLPPHIDSVHLLPVFEPGVVGSLYGMASWRINSNFFDPKWQRIFPAQVHVNDQLRAFVNICHALGKVVGLDVIPHTDRFAEIALCNPWLFEWVKRSDTQIIDHRAELHHTVEECIVMFARGRVDPSLARDFFARPEHEIGFELFGNGDAFSRNERRDALIQFLYNRGYETLPATMAPPYRGLELDPSPEAVTVDEKGRAWRDFRITKPEEMSRVFGPLTRYKLWDRLDDNQNWQIDFKRPRVAVWNYVADHYQQVVAQFGFDFMRGDMSHVQMRPSGVPKQVPAYYDLLRYVKEACAKTYPHFAYFAESFLTADDYMTYGSEWEHLAASNAEVALGNLQNYAPTDDEFHAVLSEYAVQASKQPCTPAFTIFSADKDDPRFDRYFLSGNVSRYFVACFCPLWPSYSSLGFRQRDPHPTPAANEHYTKLYVFQYDQGSKATKGPYRWGANADLYAAIGEIDQLRESFTPPPVHEFNWIEAPDATGKRKTISWTWGDTRFAVDFTTDEWSISPL